MQLINRYLLYAFSNLKIKFIEISLLKDSLAKSIAKVLYKSNIIVLLFFKYYTI